MKLRNKKTGKVINKNYPEKFVINNNGTIYLYDSLAELNEEWEDYEPKEPLIKDEKIRKAVKAWSEVESIQPEETVFYNADEYCLGYYRSEIEFSKHIQGLKEGDYTIAELCGEVDNEED